MMHTTLCGNERGREGGKVQTLFSGSRWRTAALLWGVYRTGSKVSSAWSLCSRALCIEWSSWCFFFCLCFRFHPGDGPQGQRPGVRHGDDQQRLLRGSRLQTHTRLFPQFLIRCVSVPHRFLIILFVKNII